MTTPKLAAKTIVEREVKTIVKEEYVTLNLTREQAEHLFMLVGSIGGDKNGYTLSPLNAFVPNYCGQLVVADKATLRKTTSALYEGLGEVFYGTRWPKYPGATGL